MLSHCGNAAAKAGGKFAAAERRQAREQVLGLGQEAPQRVQQYRSLPEEHARVPIEIPGREKLFRRSRVGFLAEAHDANRFAIAGRDAFGKFDIAVAGLSPARLDPQHHDIAFGGGLESGTQQADVFAGLGDHVVRRKDSHQSVGIDRLQNVRREPDRRSGVALRRLGQNLAFGNLGQLLHDLGAKLGVGENPDALGRKHRPQAVDRLLNQAAVPEELQDLLGAAAPATRPKPGAAAAGQDQTIVMRHATRSEFRAPALACGSIASW